MSQSIAVPTTTTTTSLDTDETPNIFDVLENVKAHQFFAKVRIKDIAKNFQGDPKRDVSLSFSFGQEWYTIICELKGDKLRDVAPLIEAYCHEKWCLAVVSGIRAGKPWTNKKGETVVTYYAQQCALILDLHSMIIVSGQMQQQSAEGSEDSPF